MLVENIKLPNNILVKVEGKKYYFNCWVCGSEIYRFKSSLTGVNPPKFICCGRECKHRCKENFEWSQERKDEQSSRIKGENNPNFGNRWSDELKSQVSSLVKERYRDDKYYEKFCEVNRSRVWTEEGKRSLSESVSNRMKGVSRPHTEDTKKLIGKKSREKWEREGYKENHRVKMEEMGLYIPLEDKTDYELYFKEADWIERMFDRITDPEQLSLLKERGVFNPRKNKDGLVRDHIYGRRYGFTNGVPPFIIHHPCNCQLITNVQNIKKGFEKEKGISLKDLYLKILNYGDVWVEQDKCVEYIKSQGY